MLPDRSMSSLRLPGRDPPQLIRLRSAEHRWHSPPCSAEPDSLPPVPAQSPGCPPLSSHRIRIPHPPGRFRSRPESPASARPPQARFAFVRFHPDRLHALSLPARPASSCGLRLRYRPPQADRTQTRSFPGCLRPSWTFRCPGSHFHPAFPVHPAAADLLSASAAWCFLPGRIPPGSFHPGLRF